MLTEGDGARRACHPLDQEHAALAGVRRRGQGVRIAVPQEVPDVVREESEGED
jgi:hypothetical protein